jgi:hypothetical protein
MAQGIALNDKIVCGSESRRAVSPASLMRTVTCMVRPERGWIPVTAWMDMVGSSAAAGGGCSSWSSITSMVNKCLHTYLCPCLKRSSQWKHFPSLRWSAISMSDSRRVVVGFTTDAEGATGSARTPQRLRGKAADALRTVWMQTMSVALPHAAHKTEQT